MEHTSTILFHPSAIPHGKHDKNVVIQLLLNWVQMQSFYASGAATVNPAVLAHGRLTPEYGNFKW